LTVVVRADGIAFTAREMCSLAP